MRKSIAIALFVIVFLLLSGFIYWSSSSIIPYFFTPTDTKLETQINSESKNSADGESMVETITTELDIPWDMVFLPDESMLVSERPGTLLRLFQDSQKRIEIDGVKHIEEGGLQGIALDPNFSTNSYIYLYMTSENETGLINRVVRYSFNMETNSLTDQFIIIDEIPGAKYHDGGRIAFGPDNLLYIATGDATNENSAQDVNSLAGKILRLNADGSIPANNPFNNAIYSLGHRNPQGMAWDSEGNLWATEHGPSGAQTGNDEVNKIEKGENYGWPIIKGQQTQNGLSSPIIESGEDETWAPTGMEIVDEKLFFTGLRGEAIYVSTITDGEISKPKVFFQQEFGRLRFIKQGPDGWFYIGTSNTDGRGFPRPNDDKLIKIHPSMFQ